MSVLREIEYKDIVKYHNRAVMEYNNPIYILRNCRKPKFLIERMSPFYIINKMNLIKEMEVPIENVAGFDKFMD